MMVVPVRTSWDKKQWDKWLSMFWSRHVVPQGDRQRERACDHFEGRDVYQVGKERMYCQACWMEFFTSQANPGPERKSTTIVSKATLARQLGKKQPGLSPPAPIIEEDSECQGAFGAEHDGDALCPVHGASDGLFGPLLRFPFADEKWFGQEAGEAGAGHTRSGPGSSSSSGGIRTSP